MIGRRLVATSALVLVVAGLWGCADPAETLDRPATQRRVGRAVAAKVEPAVAATTCPAALPVGKGEKFSCEVRLGDDAGTLKVVVAQTDDQGTLDVTPTAAVLSGEDITAQLKARLKEQFDRSFQVSCADDEGWNVREPLSTSTCVARDRTSRRSITVTVTDPDGTLRFEVGPEVD